MIGLGLATLRATNAITPMGDSPTDHGRCYGAGKVRDGLLISPIAWVKLDTNMRPRSSKLRNEPTRYVDKTSWYLDVLDPTGHTEDSTA